ncbi:MAG: (2Fe-2S)-binding protein, partial [Actinomycetota bacterium]|nr:(2Fe-2S)-binding protein [Actinomycetota bacterium]
MALLPRLLDRVTTTIEEADVLDGAADALGSIAGRLPAGRVKDLLSGTRLGHPLHPVLVVVPIGAFSSAVYLDVTGGSAQAARRLVGLG